MCTSSSNVHFIKQCALHQAIGAQTTQESMFMWEFPCPKFTL